jgi:HD-GYP domain-containing protein (c-di-GMP phosphodiesterase class II)
MRKDLDTRKGLVLVAGSPGSGRARTLQALAGETDPNEESLLLLSFDETRPTVSGSYPAMTLDLRRELWALLDDIDSLDVDRFVMPELQTPLHATLAVALSGSRRLGFAPIRAQDSSGALVKMRELAADRYRVGRDLVGVLSQCRLPRPCPGCSELRAIDERDLPEDGWGTEARGRVLARRPEVRSRGKGCTKCSGSGYDGWTYLYEYLSVTDEIAGLLRATEDPGKLREELKSFTAGRGLLDTAWRETLRGHIEVEELGLIPGPEVVPFCPDLTCLDAQPETRHELESDAEPDVDGETFLPSGELSPDGPPIYGPRLEHPLLRRCYEPVRRIVAAIDGERSIEAAPLAAVAERVLTATERDPKLVHIALTAGRGDNLVIHQLNVAVLAVRIAMGLRWDRPRLTQLAMAALLHDVGLLKIPLQVLQKEGGLTSEEHKLRRRHVEWTVKMLSVALPDCEWLHAVVGQVHERESGRGFPDGLTGDRIEPAAKILGLADALEALTHPRPGREALCPFDAIQFLLKNHADDFDRKVFRSMVRQISPYPAGSRVRLNNGSTARVASVNPDNFYRPKVEILCDPTGKRVSGGAVMDLDRSPFLYIIGLSRDELSGNSAGAPS